ncbi:MAG: LLM class flavin-dependent oxidoreductase [Dehalococcoidia bacterium]|nr:LLM class flavin-dependent oxidoreductase [Dehalococcoidia bacterium]
MKFGLLYEMRLNPGVTEAQMFQDVLEEVVFAEQMGFDYVWMVEHHFTTTSSHSSAPEVFYGALAARTSRIRLGRGVVLLPSKINHPIRVAEQVAALDVLSNGRADFGTGRSSPYEQLGFEVDPADSRPMWEEAIKVIPRMWTEDVFTGYQGEYFNIPPRMIVPKPVQKPHPPMWMALAQPASFDVAASHGLGVLCNSVGIPQRLTRRVRMYKDAVQSPTDPVSSVINNQVAAFAHTLCAEDDKPTREFIGQAYRASFRENLSLAAGAGIVPNSQYGASLEDFYIEYSKQLEDAGKPFPEFLKYSLEREQGAHLQRDTLQVLSGDQLVNDAVVIGGDPESCIRGLKMYEESGIDQFMVQPDWGFITHEQIMESYRLFGKYIIPKFKGAEVAAGVRT